MRRVVVGAVLAIFGCGGVGGRGALAQATDGAAITLGEKEVNLPTSVPASAPVEAQAEGSTRPAITSTSQPSAPGIKDIQTMLAKVVEAGTSKGDFDTLISFLAKPDRDRLSDAGTRSWSDLDGRIDQFRKDWQAKYGQDFKLTDKQSLVFDADRVLIAMKDAPPADSNPATTTATATTGASAEFVRTTSKSAICQFLGGPNAPTATLPLVNEGTLVASWRLDIPDDFDSQKLHDHLLRHLTMFDQDKANWPSDVNQAFVLAAQHVLTALVESAAVAPATAPVQPVVGE